MEILRSSPCLFPINCIQCLIEEKSNCCAGCCPPGGSGDDGDLMMLVPPWFWWWWWKSGWYFRQQVDWGWYVVGGGDDRDSGNSDGVHANGDDDCNGAINHLGHMILMMVVTTHNRHSGWSTLNIPKQCWILRGSWPFCGSRAAIDEQKGGGDVYNQTNCKEHRDYWMFYWSSYQAFTSHCV